MKEVLSKTKRACFGLEPRIFENIAVPDGFQDEYLDGQLYQE